LFDANPDRAFTTDDIARHCYECSPGRAERVAVLRAADKVMAIDPDWHSGPSRTPGQMLIFWNAASVRSVGHSHAPFMPPEHAARRLKRRDKWTAEERAEIRRAVAEHIALRDAATPEERERLLAQYAAEREREREERSARWREVLSIHPPAEMDNTYLAAKARALMLENDPDVIRAGLAEIAEALDTMPSG
jgi:hypothetical protein